MAEPLAGCVDCHCQTPMGPPLVERAAADGLASATASAGLATGDAAGFALGAALGAGEVTGLAAGERTGLATAAAGVLPAVLLVDTAVEVAAGGAGAHAARNASATSELLTLRGRPTGRGRTITVDGHAYGPSSPGPRRIIDRLNMHRA